MPYLSDMAFLFMDTLSVKESKTIEGLVSSKSTLKRIIRGVNHYEGIRHFKLKSIRFLSSFGMTKLEQDQTKPIHSNSIS